MVGIRGFLGAATMASMLALAGAGPAAGAGAPFAEWLAGLRAEALERGVRAETLDAALAGLEPIPRVIELDRKQPEFTLTFEEYLDRVVSERRVRAGRARMAAHRDLLRAVARDYRVQPRFIVALWGIESDFGRLTGGFPVIAALATLAHDGRRSAFFRRELLLALEILDAGHVAPGAMSGSWAGAMGQNQFMPSSYRAFAVDRDGDGRRDIWTSLPDVFASIANYLAKSGWRDDRTWGRPVALPPGFPADLVGRGARRGLNEWQRLGVRRPGGANLPARNLPAYIVAPQRGALAPAFVAYSNYDAILKWNRSNYFAIAVGTLADRLRG